ncbi:T9SS type A sorting domain-containing protein [Vicingaceae bacterium]|nr:T9SS type A sorting domain-containing protein [Vicingaceae bacterium]
MKKVLLLTALFCAIQVFAQQRIDGNFSFQTDPAKKYSLYIPSNYDANTPNKMMLGLHPLNTARWNGISWCDTLINFAEMNNLILVCPDGGVDGRIDDAIDTAFTSALIDSARFWYNIDTEKTYVMGFSWGARTTYTYGLNRPSVFGGYLPIGAAITNTNEVSTTLQSNSSGKPVYILHGGNDSPNTRFYPVRTALINSGAIVNSLLQSGVGHTIDFPNRDAILTIAYTWIDSVNCANITVSTKEFVETKLKVTMFPNPTNKKEGLTINLVSNFKEQEGEVKIFDLQGMQLKQIKILAKNGINKVDKELISLPSGTYLVSIKLDSDKRAFSNKIVLE